MALGPGDARLLSDLQCLSVRLSVRWSVCLSVSLSYVTCPGSFCKRFTCVLAVNVRGGHLSPTHCLWLLNKLQGAVERGGHWYVR